MDSRTDELSSRTAVLNVVRERKVIGMIDRVGPWKRIHTREFVNLTGDGKKGKYQRMTVVATRKRSVVLLIFSANLMVALAHREAYSRRTLSQKFARQCSIRSKSYVLQRSGQKTGRARSRQRAWPGSEFSKRHTFQLWPTIRRRPPAES